MTAARRPRADDGWAARVWSAVAALVGVRQVSQPGSGTQDIELSLSPRTGQPLAARRALRELGRRHPSRPVERKDTEGSATGGCPALTVTTSVLAPPLRRVDVPAPARAAALRAAADAKDVEKLAAQASADPPSELAALVLAGVIGRTLGDSRADGWLDQAFALGADPELDELLAPHLAQLTVIVDLPSWDIHEGLPLTRESLGIAVAIAEYNAGDAAAAYGLLLDTPDTGRVRALRAVCCLDLEWWSRAARAARCDTTQVPWRSLLDLAAAIAAHRSGEFMRAVELLDVVVAEVAQVPQRWVVRALLERASAHQGLGEAHLAWDDLTAAAALDPDDGRVREALKAL